MSFSRSNNKMVISLLTLLVFLMVATNTYYYNKMSETKEEVEKLKKSERIKENEILKLEEELNKVKNENENLKEENSNLKSENEKLKNENEKLKKELEKYDSLRKLNMVATAYTSECDGCTGITATGYDVRNTVYKDGYRVVATDKSVIPMESLLYIESVNNSFEPFVAISSDVGGAIKGNRIDILVENKSKAYDFGVRDVKVTVLREGSG